MLCFARTSTEPAEPSHVGGLPCIQSNPFCFPRCPWAGKTVRKALGAGEETSGYSLFFLAPAPKARLEKRISQPNLKNEVGTRDRRVPRPTPGRQMRARGASRHPSEGRSARRPLARPWCSGGLLSPRGGTVTWVDEPEVGMRREPSGNGPPGYPSLIRKNRGKADREPRRQREMNHSRF